MAYPRKIKVMRAVYKGQELNLNSKDNFHTALSPIIALVQFLGFFPFNGVLQKDIEAVNFKWLSFHVLHSVAWLVSGFVFAYLEYLTASKFGGLNAKNINGIVFYSCGIFSAALFIQLGKHWPQIVKSAAETESLLNTDAYSGNSGNSFAKNVRRSSIPFLLFALSEHMMAWSSFLYDRLTQSRLCKWEIGSYFYFIATKHLRQVYDVFPVNIWIVIWAEFMNSSMTFIWSFNDLFIILVSYYIASLFRKINHRLEFFKGRIVNNKFWEEIRSDYTKVCELQEFFDEKIGNIVCLACLVDLYFICLQLLNVSTPLPFLINSVYYWYSLVFLVVRTTATFLVASKINEESKVPIKLLRTIPTEGWFEDTQRFAYQLQNQCVAMSGNKFFLITRGIIMSIAGTVVTYELVMIQFDGQKMVSDLFTPCPNLTLAELY